jgi:hypothetical protein
LTGFSSELSLLDEGGSPVAELRVPLHVWNVGWSLDSADVDGVKAEAEGNGKGS